MIAVGASLAAALALAVEVETLAEIYWRALQVGEPVLLSDAEMDVVSPSSRLTASRGADDCANRGDAAPDER